MSLWTAVRSLFIPQVSVRPVKSLFEGDPDQTRKERPLPTYTVTRWYQRDIEDAIRTADAGDMASAARLSRSLRRDGVLGGVLSTRTGGLTRLPKVFRGDVDVVQALDTFEGPGLFDRIFTPKELALLAGDGILLGVGVGELVRVPWRAEPVFVRLDPEFLRYRWSDDTWYYHSIGGLLPITPGDGRWILHMPGGYQQPWSNGLWASLSRSYVAKDHAFHARENYSGKLANPARVAVAPQGASEAQKQSWFQRVMAWGLNSVFALTPGYDVKLLESNGRGYEVFQQTIDSSDKEFMICLAGQVVTITGGAGFANADIHATIRSDLIQDDGDGLASTINEQGLRPVVNQFFGGGALGSMAWDTRPPADLAAEANAISAAAKAIADANQALAPYGMRVNAREMTTRFKVPVEAITALNAPSLANDNATPPADGAGATDAPPTDEAAAALAAKMTEHGVSRCEHGALNRCRLCGVERVRDFVPGVDGEPEWQVAWRPIAARHLTIAPRAA